MTHHNAAPVAASDDRTGAVGVTTEGVVVIGGEPDGVAGSAEHLQGCTSPGHGWQWRRTAHVDDGSPHLEQRVGVDHHRHVLGDIECRAIRQRVALGSLADQIRKLVRIGGSIAGVPHDADHLVGARSHKVGVLSGRKCLPYCGVRGGQTTVGSGGGSGLVNEDGGVFCGCPKPEAELATSFPITIAIKFGAGDIKQGVRGVADRVELESQFVFAVSPPTVATVIDLWIKRRVAGAGHSDEVGVGVAFVVGRFQIE